LRVSGLGAGNAAPPHATPTAPCIG
jgi:hypothetical protein